MASETGTEEWALAVHGGASATLRHHSDDEHAARHEAIGEALAAGAQILISGGASVDAVEAAVRVLEDAPGFNAGRGATLAREGYAELDASIMDGRMRSVGAVAGLRRVKNPIDLARAVMDRSAHVFLLGEGAEQFAAVEGIALVDPEYFIIPRQRDELQRIIEISTTPRGGAEMSGTVGAVARDREGNLAAATSTGGIPNKRYGRVGDTPIIGAGTYAENGVCAVSATGWGEYFIRTCVAYDLCARMKYRQESVENAAKAVLDQVCEMGGYGGLIAIDARGQIAMPYRTPTMPRGCVTANQRAVIVVERQ